MKKSILVTGGAGFIGSFLVDELIRQGHHVTIFDNLEPQVHHGKLPDYINQKAKFINGDIRDYELLKKHVVNSEIIFNFASRVGVNQSMYEIKDYIDTNTQGTGNLMHILANENHNVKKVIVASSMTIYGEGSYKCEHCNEEYHNVERTQKQLDNKQWELICPDCQSILSPVPTKETKPLSSKSVYGLTKKYQEELTLQVGKTYGVPSVALRFFNAYGPRQSLNNPYTGVTAIFLNKIKNKKTPLIFEDGLQGRDFVNVKDVIQSCILTMNSNIANYDTFNVGTGNVTSILKIAETLIELLDSSAKPKIIEKYRKGDIRHCISDISKIKKKLEFEPIINFKEGIKEVIDWSNNR